MLVGVGGLIWMSVKPLIRLMICVGCGFVITKADIFPAVAAKGAGQIVLNVTLPSLMFSRIVPAFSSSNTHALGPLFLVAVLYEVVGMLIALVVKQFFWVPHRFRYGIIVAGGWGNTADIPTSIILSVCGSAPFNGISDQNLSVAYISAFNLIFMLTLFPMGGHRLIAKDFAGPGLEDDEVREEMRKKRKAMLVGFTTFLRGGFRCLSTTTRRGNDVLVADLEKTKSRSIDGPQKNNDDDNNTNLDISKASQLTAPTRPLYSDVRSQYSSSTAGKHVAFYPDPITVVDNTALVRSGVFPTAAMEVSTSRVKSLAGSITSHADNDNHPPGDAPETLSTVSATISSQVVALGPASRLKRLWESCLPFLRSLFAPASVSILLAFPIALITPVKALFVLVPGMTRTIPNGPDGLPPLSFVMDATTFIGGASVPLGLICLGSALARLSVPRGEWGRLPLGAIGWMAIGRLVVGPVLGVVVCEGLRRVGMIDANDKVLRLVCIFMSCLPTATSQVYLTQVYSGTGNAEHLSAFIIPQYMLMLFSMTGLLVYTLGLLF